MQNITDTIIRLQKLKDKYGDLEVYQLSFPSDDYLGTVKKYDVDFAVVADPLNKDKLILVID
jgi:hypothetical protein